MSQDWARPVVHWELVASDADRQATFYRELFNWHIGEGAVMPIPAGLGGPEPGPAGHLRSGDHPGISLFVQVRDIRESLALAETLGGRRVRDPYMTPTGTTLASILDPEGNRVVLVQQ
ncbi:MAG TPA: VOC family protein [Chloroflexota bacterium]